MSILYLENVDSTNTYIKENILADGDIVYTLNQTAGRGRLGRSWYGKDCLALSILHKPKDTTNLPVISLIFGTAVCQALIKLTGLNLKIKWPNDIVINGKKLCGLLVECVTDKSGVKVICGAGINIYNDSFPDDIKSKATSLKLLGINNIDITHLIKTITDQFQNLVSCGYKVPDQFNNLCLTIGSEVIIQKGNQQLTAVATKVNTDGSLTVKTLEGREIIVSSGEVSVRGLLGYI